MSPVRILAAATAIEVSFLAGALALAGAAGATYPWLDLINSFIPAIAVLGLAGAAAARAVLPRTPFRIVCVTLGLLAAIYGLAVMVFEAAPAWSFGTSAGPRLRVVSANVYRDNVSPLHAALALVGRRADVILMQEADALTVPERSRIVLDRTYPYAASCPGQEMEVRAKTPFLASGCEIYLRAGQPNPVQPLLLWARIQGPGGRVVTVATTHLARPYPPARQAMERVLLGDAMRRILRGGGPLVVAGDFNTAPWSFGMRRQDRALRPLRRWTGLWPTYPAQINTTLKPWPLPIFPIDHLYASPDLRVRLERFRVMGSDHLAQEAEVTLAR